MNDTELDAVARRAVALTRADARAIADSEAALRRLLDDAAARPTPGAGPTLETVAVDDRRPRTRIVAVAAAVVALAVGLAWVVASGRGRIQVAEGPARGSGVPAGVTAPGTPVPSSASGDTAAQSVPGSTTDPTGTSAAGTNPAVTTNSPSSDGPAGFVAPADVAPSTLDDVPTLLPGPTPPSDLTYTVETESSEPSAPSRVQSWLHTGPDGIVDRSVVITTHAGGEPVWPAGVAITVPGWDAAQRDLTPPSAPYAAQLRAGAVSIAVLVSGSDDETAEALLGGIVADGDRWRIPSIEADGWLRIDGEWSSGQALRSLVTLDREGDVDTQLDVTRGSALRYPPPTPGVETRLVDIDGAPGFLSRGGVSSLTIARPDGTTVRIGSRDPNADLVAAAGSLTDVTPETWRSSGRTLPEGVGCVGLFC